MVSLPFFKYFLILSTGKMIPAFCCWVLGLAGELSMLVVGAWVRTSPVSRSSSSGILPGVFSWMVEEPTDTASLDLDFFIFLQVEVVS